MCTFTCDSSFEFCCWRDFWWMWNAWMLLCIQITKFFVIHVWKQNKCELLVGNRFHVREKVSKKKNRNSSCMKASNMQMLSSKYTKFAASDAFHLRPLEKLREWRQHYIIIKQHVKVCWKFIYASNIRDFTESIIEQTIATISRIRDTQIFQIYWMVRKLDRFEIMVIIYLLQGASIQYICCRTNSLSE